MTQKTNRLHFSTRTIAMVLSVIMLIGSIATGSMLSTFAAYLKDSANSDAVSQAASEGRDIALNAIPSENAAVDNAEEKPDLSGFEENEIVRGMKKNLADTGANIDLSGTGYDTWYVRGSWDKNGSGVWVDHQISTTQSYSVSLEAGTDYQFVFKGNNDQFSANTTISGTTDYNFSRNDSDSITLHTTIAGTYTFKFKGMDGGGTAMQTRIEFPVDTTPDTWTVAGGTGGKTAGGQADNLFTSTWDTTLTQNDMTNTSGTTWTWTKSNVTLPAGNILCKVVKNHAWDTAYPSSNQSYNIATAGAYNVTITFDSSNHDVTISVTAAAKSRLTLDTNSNATVTASYGGTTVKNTDATKYIDNIPQGASVSITVAPVSGKKCTGVTGTYTGGTVSGTGSAGSWTLTMPAADTTVSVTLANVTMKKIYFNNNYTQYGTVYAYVYDKDGTNHTYEYLGKRPGKVMQEAENSEIWYIEVPEDVHHVEFISGDGKTTDELTIPWTTYTYPKYTAPYNYNAPTEANGGTWGNYIWGSTNKRGNEYTVTDGTTMDTSTNPNLFTGITATLYDYYVDGEVDGSNGWLQDIGSSEYSKSGDYEWHPYDKLNAALSSYADADKTRSNANWSNPSQPKYGVTYPLYFGNLNTKHGGDAMTTYVNGLFNWHFGANNSNGLSATNNAAIGLSGKTLGDDNTIHYYKSGATNENGAPMAMFNEDFLSGENSQNKELATILRTSSFPVRKEEHVDGTTSISKIYLDPGVWGADNAVFDVWYNGANTWKKMTASGSLYVADVPTGATTATFVRRGPNQTRESWDNGTYWNQTDDITLTLSGNNAKNKYSITGWGDGKSPYSASLDTSLDGSRTGGHTYYEFDSTNGKDNAYITDISKSNKTAKINYYTDKKVKSSNGTYGFFPFDYNNYQNNTSSSAIAHDLGFGMKLTIPFTLNGSGANNGLDVDNTHQKFNFSGDDDLWVFVDGKLVLDLGGAHGRTEGSIDFRTKTVTANNTEAIPSGITAGTDRNGSFATGFNTNENYVHTMTIYYMERGMIDSNLQFGFSFHAIPNQFWIDKKIRTKDKYNLGYDTINSGFFTNNNQSDAASNMTTYTLGDKTTSMTKFEKSYQDEQFTVTQWYGSNGATPNTLAAGKNYTIDYDENTHTTESDGQYHIYHDLGNAFIGQFTKGDKFKLKETISNSNKYVYTPVFSVWDQANNDKEITASGDNTNGYTFDFSPTTTVSTGIENTNIKARFDNYMVAHDLTLTKEITNATDTKSDFTFQILFDFTGSSSPDYVAYPLYCDVDGARTQLSNDGTITIKAGQTVNIFEIPQNAKIQVTEVLTDTVSSYRYVGATIKRGTTDVTSSATPVTKGYQFTIGNDDMYVTFSNKKPDNRYTIKYIYQSYDNLYGNQSYTVSGVFSEKDLTSYLELDDSGNLQFKSPELKKNFINSKSPYENNFQQTVSFANATIDDTSEGKGWVNGNYFADATAATTNEKISVYFYLPYDVDNETTLIPQESGSSGKVAKIANKAVGSKKIDCFDWYVTAGATKKTSGWEAKDTTFVNAPLMIYNDVNDDSTVQYFQYWSVKKLSGYGMKAAEYTRCYDYQFNLSLFMDCYIEPVYASTWAQKVNPPQTYNSYDRFDPEAQITGDTTKGISVTFLENSRNQYNQNGKGQRNTTNTAMDVIYSDFLLSFNKVDGITQLNTLNPNTKKAGLIIEAVNYLSGSNATGFDASKDYSKDSDYNSDEGTKRTDIISWLEGGTKASDLKAAKSEFDVTSLDNKNCLQYYYSFNNRACNNDTQELLNTTQNRYKVFRAYSYIGDVSGTALENVTLSLPIYFTIYDIGKLYDLADNANVQ